MLTARLTLGRDNPDVDMKKISKRDDFPHAKPGDVVFFGFVGVVRQNQSLDGRDDHLCLASPEYVFSGTGRCFYGLEIEFPVGTPVQVMWTAKGFEVQKLDVRAEYSFDLLTFLADFMSDPDMTVGTLDTTGFAHPNRWTGVWRLAAAPEPWHIMHKLLLVEIAAGCPNDKFQWEQDVAPQQVLVLEGALYQTVLPGQFMSGATQHIRTDPDSLTRFLAFYTGPRG